MLPANHTVMDLLIQDTHLRLHHAGVRATLAELKERFWPIRCRQQVKRVLRKCVICQKLQSRPFDEVAAPLPLDRTRQAAPFEIVGVDFTGPLLVKPFKKIPATNTQPGAVEPEKAYLCLFICAVTRAIHLELTRDLTASTFILALRRFFARRAISSIFYSDNAQTFQCAEKYLRSLQADPSVSDWKGKSTTGR
jgi:Integrase zinc binding domain